MEKTRLLYLPEFNVTAGTATVIECRPNNDCCDLVLDQTVFYPGGGGQPADTGQLVAGDVTLPVQAVWMEEPGIVLHRVASCPLVPGATIHMQVDTATRRLHERLHSAGHVIDLAVHRLGYDWTPTKGAHFPTMAFVEYAAPTPLAADTQATLQQQCNQLIAAGSTNVIKFLTPEGQPLTDPGLGHMDAERIVEYDGFGLGCGGTHVADIAAIGELIIRKVKRKKGVVKVSYALAQP